MKIHYKIVIPFTLLVIATTLVTTFVSISLISGALELRVKNQVEHVSEMISLSGFAVNPSILEKLKRILDAEIITYGRDGQVIATTLAGPEEAGLLSVVQSPLVTQQIFEQGDRLVTREISYRGQPYLISYRPLPGSPDTVVAFVVATSDIARAKSDIARTIATLAVLVVLLMALFSQMIAQSITSPVRRLVDFTKRVAGGDLTGRADVASRDEIRNLATSFNEMVQQLQESEGKLFRSETLAIAGQLAAGVAHEIRNPLSSIKMQAQDS